MLFKPPKVHFSVHICQCACQESSISYIQILFSFSILSLCLEIIFLENGIHQFVRIQTISHTIRSQISIIRMVLHTIQSLQSWSTFFFWTLHEIQIVHIGLLIVSFVNCTQPLFHSSFLDSVLHSSHMLFILEFVLVQPRFVLPTDES